MKKEAQLSLEAPHFVGLTREQVEERLKIYGLNIPFSKKEVVWTKILFEQFKNVLVIILMLAAIVSFLVGEQTSAMVILFTLLLNILLGFFEDFKSERSINKLKSLSKDNAIVIRNGKEKVIDSKYLVPGDIIVLKEGMKVTADAEIIQSYDLRMNESMLTGESLPAYKSSKAKEEKKRMVFAGTFVVSGYGVAKVVKTGKKTELGRISEVVSSFNEKRTPLQVELDNTGKIIGSIVLLLSVIILFGLLVENHLFLKLVYGLVNFQEQRMILNALIVSIALSVAAVPEGLPTIVTLTLALGSRRFLKNHILIKRLSSVETLGDVDVICSDKTGTITEGRMKVVSLFLNNKIFESDKNPSNLDKLLTIGVLCNEANLDENSGSPTELSLLRFAKSKRFKLKNHEKIFEIPFSHERKFMLTVHKINSKFYVSVKGAPEVILNKCSRILLGSRIVRLSPSQRRRIINYINSSSERGLRNIGFAYKEIKQFNPNKVDNSLIFVGIASLEDSPRREVKHAVEVCKEAGIKVVMITGDYGRTAESVANSVGISGESISGQELDKLSDEELSEVIDKYAVFYRVFPIHKMRILKALKSKGHIVAMTGDGVNDAPALKVADIGISVNSGTDVAKDSADMILLDNNFASIVKAVEEGRRIYSNIRKSIRYLLSSNIAEVALIFLAILFKLPLPLIAVQILWMNLMTDSFPAFALALEPSEDAVMKKNPRPKSESIINRKEMIFIAFIASVISAFALLVFSSNLPRITYARTSAFTAMVLFELANVINSKSEDRPSLRSRLFSNPLLITALLFSLALQFAVVYWHPLQVLFNTEPLTLKTLSMILSFALLVILAGDIVKLYNNITSQSRRMIIAEKEIEKNKQ